MHQSIEDKPRRARKRVTYTVDEVRSAIVYVHKVVMDIMDETANLCHMAHESDADSDEVVIRYDAFDKYVSELESMGLKVEDPARGVVLFPSRHKGAKVWIIWCALTADLLRWKHPYDGAKPMPIETLREAEDDDG